MFTLPLYKEKLSKTKTRIAQSEHFDIHTFIYNSGVHAVEIQNSKGRLVILPFMGQMIWDAEFLGTDLCMKNMFSEPKPAKTIVETLWLFCFPCWYAAHGLPNTTR